MPSMADPSLSRRRPRRALRQVKVLLPGFPCLSDRGRGSREVKERDPQSSVAMRIGGLDRALAIGAGGDDRRAPMVQKRAGHVLLSVGRPEPDLHHGGGVPIELDPRGTQPDRQMFSAASALHATTRPSAVPVATRAGERARLDAPVFDHNSIAGKLSRWSSQKSIKGD